jgi:hypothetical protein
MRDCSAAYAQCSALGGAVKGRSVSSSSWVASKSDIGVTTWNTAANAQWRYSVRRRRAAASAAS